MNWEEEEEEEGIEDDWGCEEGKEGAKGSKVVTEGCDWKEEEEEEEGGGGGKEEVEVEGKVEEKKGSKELWKELFWGCFIAVEGGGREVGVIEEDWKGSKALLFEKEELELKKGSKDVWFVVLFCEGKEFEEELLFVIVFIGARCVGLRKISRSCVDKILEELLEGGACESWFNDLKKKKKSIEKVRRK